MNPLGKEVVDNAVHQVQSLTGFQITDVMVSGAIILLIGLAVFIVLKVASKLIKVIAVLLIAAVIAALFFGVDPFGLASYIRQAEIFMRQYR